MVTEINLAESINRISDLNTMVPTTGSYIGKLVRKNDGPEEIAEIIGTITKYGEQQQDK